MTLSRAFVMGYVIFACVAVATFVVAHDGWTGDADPYAASIVNPEAKNVHAPRLVFNKWKIDYDHEPLVLKAFLIVNGPAYALALLSYKVLRLLPPFDDLFPLGVSYPSYQLGLMLLLGFGQWYVVGTLLDRWKRGKRGTVHSSTILGN